MRFALLGGMLVVLLSPLIAAMWLSFTPGDLLEPPGWHWSLRWYIAFFDDARWTGSLVQSLWVALWASLIATGAGVSFILGLPVVMPSLRPWLRGAVLTPLVLPPVVVAMALLPVVQALGVGDGSVPLILAHSVLGLPLAVIALSDGVRRLDPVLLQAARGLGAGAGAAFRRVWLPLMAPSVVLSGICVFIVSVNEFILALFLAPPGSETLPKVIWPNLRYTLTPLVAAASTVSVILTLAALVAMMVTRRWYRQRAQGAAK